MGNLPFVFGTVSTGENFIGREDETSHLLMNFRHRVNTIIMSPRRIGKTSLVNKVKEMSTSPTLKVVYMDIFSCRNEDDFYSMFATQLVRQTESSVERFTDSVVNFLSGLKPQITIGPDPMTSFNVSFDIQRQDSISEEVLSLPEKIAQKKDIRIVVCIDEFQQVAEFPESLTFQKKLRSCWQHNERVCYCLFGSKRHMMKGIFGDKNKPFYRFGEIITLAPIPTEKWVEYIAGQFAKTGKRISAPLAERICSYVENNSGYVQQLAWIVWIMTESSADDIDYSLAEKRLLDENTALFEAQIEKLSAPQLNFLRALASGIEDGFMRQDILKKYNLGTAGNITAIKTALEKKELIEISLRKIQFSDPVLKQWIKERL